MDKLSLEKYISSDRARSTFYPTPENVAEKLTKHVNWRMVASILEPSAGKGDLARYAACKIHNRDRSYPVYDDRSMRQAIEDADIDCIEIDPVLRSTLEGEGFRVVQDDFLRFETQKRYDLVLMNPPFDQGAKHLLKALELMRYGGQIACILNAETIQNPFSVERQELAAKLESLSAKITYLADAFIDAERRTPVAVALVNVDIPKTETDSTIMDEMRKAPAYKTQTIDPEYADMVRYNEIDKWVSRYDYEVACGIRLIEEYQAMRPYMIDDPESKYGNPILTLTVKVAGKDREALINAYIRETRGKYWRAIFQQKTFTQKLTGNLLQELYNSVNRLKDYDFSAYNILTLLIKMNAKVVNGIEETIIALFDDWTHLDYHKNSPNRHYYNGWKTNSAFRVGKKVILPFYGAYDSWDHRFRSYNVLRKLEDIEKTFDFLDSGRTDWAGSLGGALEEAERTGNTRNIDTKYFSATFYKKGTAHLIFKNEDLLEKFNLFASMKKGWLPPNYGKAHYSDLSEEEKDVVDSFQGKERYEEIMLQADYYLNAGTNQLLMLAGQ